MSIKVAKLYNTLARLYIADGDHKSFFSAVDNVVVDGKNFHIASFSFQPTEFCSIWVSENDANINIDGIEISHGFGWAEPDLFPLLLKSIAYNLREARCLESANMEKWIGKPLLTAMVKAGYIEQIVSWRLK